MWSRVKKRAASSTRRSELNIAVLDEAGLRKLLPDLN
jgi:hypothetical protein